MFRYIVLCFNNTVLCFDNIVMCFDNTVLCFDNSLLCSDNTMLCLEKCLLCFKNCLLCLQIWATVTMSFEKPTIFAICFNHFQVCPSVRGTQRQFSENICSKEDLRSSIFETFVVQFLACLPLLGFSNI